MSSGWNLIGTITDHLAVSSIAQDPVESIISLFKFTGGYEQVFDSLRQGEGYWVNLNAAATITLNSSALLKSSSPTDHVTDILSTFKNLSLNFKSGYDTRRVNLYFKDDVDDLTIWRLNNSFELPPPAPGRGFELMSDEAGTNGLHSFAAKIGEPFQKRITIISPDGNAPVKLQWSSEGLEQGRYFLSVEKRGSEIDMASANELTLESDSEYSLEFIYKNAAQVVADYRLNQNYPNPFNPTTRISYSVESSGLVELTIFNSLGQSIRSLVSQVQEQGSYNIVWDGRDGFGREVSAGIYLYTLRVNNFISVKKMLLIK